MPRVLGYTNDNVGDLARAFRHSSKRIIGTRWLTSVLKSLLMEADHLCGHRNYGLFGVSGCLVRMGIVSLMYDPEVRWDVN